MQKRNKQDGANSNLDEIRKITQAMNEYYFVTELSGEIPTLPPLEMAALVKKQWKLVWFKYCGLYMNAKDFSQVLGSLWRDIDGAASDPYVYTKETVEWFLRADPRYLMDEEEYRIWESLPETVTVYRGVSSAMGGKTVKYAPSWTLDREEARYFQRKAAAPREWEGHLYQAAVPKKYCLAYFRDRKTVIVNTKAAAVRTRVELVDIFCGEQEMAVLTG